MQDGLIRVVLFAGGRGAASIAKALDRHPQVRLTVLVNAYDDGLSTGALRRFLPDMLGPSDIRKNAQTLAATDTDEGKALQGLLDRRLATRQPHDAARADIETLIEDLSHPARTPASLRHVGLGTARELVRFLRLILDKDQQCGFALDLNDIAIGNLVFAGAFLAAEHDFNVAVARYTALLSIRSAILNITDGQALTLVAVKSDGTLLADEASIVAPQSAAPIHEIFLLHHPLTDADRTALQELGRDAKVRWLQERHVAPLANPSALLALAEADVIIYGPGTQHSSLLPSYLTLGVPAAVAANRGAEKIFVANLTADHDTPNGTVAGVFEAFQRQMRRHHTRDALALPDMVTRLIVQQPNASTDGAARGRWLDLGPLLGQFPADAIHIDDWSDEQAKHDGGYVVRVIASRVTRALRRRMASPRHRISIIVPALNEGPRIGAVLRQLIECDLAALEMEKEIIVVDGGSNDDTVAVAERFSGVRVLLAPTPRGRGASLRAGAKAARGDILLFFPADGEYLVEDIEAVVRPIVERHYSVVFGTRATKCASIDQRLEDIYGGDKLLQFASKYGGMAIGVAALLFHERYLTDPLSTFKAFDAMLFDQLQLSANGVDLEAEIIVRLAALRVFILEVPVEFRPRRRDEGKKMSVRGGLSVLARLAAPIRKR